MSTFEFDHELNFTGAYDASIITNSEIPDKDADFQKQVEDELNKIIGIVNIYPGVSIMSSFVQYNSRNYKITFTK